LALKLKTKLNMKTNIGKAISLLNTVLATRPELDKINAAITLLKHEDEARQPLVPVNSQSAEIALQNQMIEGARRAASKLMCQVTEMRSALDRIRLRDETHGYKNEFEMCKLIASKAITAVDKLEQDAAAARS